MSDPSTASGPVLVLVEQEDGRPADSSREALTLGRRLAAALRGPLEALAVGPGAGSLAPALAPFGVVSLHAAEDDRLAAYAPAAWARCVTEAVAARRAAAVVAAGTDRGHEVLAHAAARLGLPMAANCVRADPWASPGEPLRVVRQRWGGTLLEEGLLRGAVKLLTVAPHAVAPEEVPAAGEVQVHGLRPALEARDLQVRVTAQLPREAEGVSLTEARVVVGGGRGVGGAEGFRLLEELAGLLGGAVGCSRAATSAGWRPHADQIGQTGVRIAPDLYIACGISGASQHIVGCRGAKRILVVNTDPEAPILAHADYAIIGDLHQVLPSLIAEIRRVAAGSRAGGGR